jgi:hypothetical protein
MFKSVVKKTEKGQLTVYKVVDEDDTILWVPTSLDNRHRKMIDQFVEAGGTITEEDIFVGEL